MAIWAEWNHLNQVSNLVLSVEYVEFYLLNMKFQTVKEWSTMCRFRFHGITDMCIFQSTELFTLTYGALVQQLIKDYEDDNEVNTQLERMWVQHTA